ncbi:MAG: nodulation protein NfeD [Thermocrinis sp.]|jgi:membrane-bound serine protease (ClpP class)|uniref:NfeD family protein n=1 Tax=Thermocrinis sp. TaxID=2024383 RepID=UPI00157EA249|nr:nodulation protein NfeD [Thermocrinis sp.]NAZ23005.1 nodulation protein NfeD [Thermocrinis sp.]
MVVLLILFTFLNFSFAKVYYAKWEDAVSPIMVEYIKRSLAKAEKEGAGVFILELNTPGGLETSMRQVVQEFQRTPIPVVVYVYPPGGRAASAGAIITASADIAVMAPGTNIGAAHPVPASGERMEEAMKEKVVQDMLAFVRSIAKEKGRNPSVLERMVKESISLTPDEALKEGVIDLIASNRQELLEKLNGRKVKKHGKETTIKTLGVPVVEVEESLRESFLKVITNPTIAYMLLLIGFYGIFFELYNPGAVVPGAVGVVSLLLGLYGLGIIGINWLGLLLILAGILLLALELVTPTFGGLAIAGAIALAIGSLVLISPDSPYGDIPISIIATMVLTTVFFFLVVGRLGLKAQKRKKMTGYEELIEEEGIALTDFEKGKGKVFIKGEIWNAVSKDDIKKDDTVIVKQVKGLTLYVKKAK